MPQQSNDPKALLTARTDRPRLLAVAVYDTILTPLIDGGSATYLVKCGLHVLNDDLGRAHVIAQSLEGNATADYWHAIVHRREGDFGNAKYWFARVGDHPVIRDIHGSTAGAVAFVDRCRAIGDGHDVDAEDRQWREMLALLAYSET